MLATLLLTYLSFVTGGNQNAIYTIVVNKEKVNLSSKELEELSHMLGKDCKIATMVDDNYPNRFKFGTNVIGQPIFVLYYQGDLSLIDNIKNSKAVLITGTKVTENTRTEISWFEDYDIWVVLEEDELKDKIVAMAKEKGIKVISVCTNSSVPSFSEADLCLSLFAPMGRIHQHYGSTVGLLKHLCFGKQMFVYGRNEEKNLDKIITSLALSSDQTEQEAICNEIFVAANVSNFYYMDLHRYNIYLLSKPEALNENYSTNLMKNFVANIKATEKTKDEKEILESIKEDNIFTFQTRNKEENNDGLKC